MPLRLLPVVEFEPAALGIQNFVELLDSGEWDAHWAACLASVGLHPIRPGSWFVAVDQFSSTEAFDLLLRVHLDWDPGVGLPSQPEELGPISGGYAFAVGGAVQLEPGCCCDLSDLDEWSKVRGEDLSLVPLTIGHGGYAASISDGTTTIIITSEDRGTTDTHLQYPTADFEEALARAEKERSQFAALLKKRLRDLGSVSHVDDVVGRLVYDK